MSSNEERMRFVMKLIAESEESLKILMAFIKRRVVVVIPTV